MKPSSRSRRAPAQPETSASLVDAVLARLGGDDRMREQRAFDAYVRAAGPMLGPRTQPDSLRGTTLFVRAASSPIAHEVTLLRAEILARIQAIVGPSLVTELRTRVGPLRAP